MENGGTSPTGMRFYTVHVSLSLDVCQSPDSKLWPGSRGLRFPPSYTDRTAQPGVELASQFHGLLLSPESKGSSFLSQHPQGFFSSHLHWVQVFPKDRKSINFRHCFCSPPHPSCKSIKAKEIFLNGMPSLVGNGNKNGGKNLSIYVSARPPAVILLLTLRTEYY